MSEIVSPFEVSVKFSAVIQTSLWVSLLLLDLWKIDRKEEPPRTSWTFLLALHRSVVHPSESSVIRWFTQIWWARLRWKTLHAFFFFLDIMWNPCKHKDLLFIDEGNSASRQAALLSFSKIRKRFCSIFWCRVTRMKTAYCVLFLLYFVNAFYPRAKIICVN